MDTVLSIVSVAVTGGLGFLGTWYRDKRKDQVAQRQRQWDREDRDEKARDVARSLLEHTQRATDAQTGKLLSAVADNTQVSVAAFTEANGYNAKIAELHTRMDGFEVLLRAINSKLP